MKSPNLVEKSHFFPTRPIGWFSDKQIGFPLSQIGFSDKHFLLLDLSSSWVGLDESKKFT